VVVVLLHTYLRTTWRRSRSSDRWVLSRCCGGGGTLTPLPKKDLKIVSSCGRWLLSRCSSWKTSNIITWGRLEEGLIHTVVESYPYVVVVKVTLLPENHLKKVSFIRLLNPVKMLFLKNKLHLYMRFIWKGFRSCDRWVISRCCGGGIVTLLHEDHLKKVLFMRSLSPIQMVWRKTK